METSVIHLKSGENIPRVVYVSIVKAYIPENYDYGKLKEKLMALAKQFGCDEFKVTENSTEPYDKSGRITGAFTYRFWWD